MRSIYTVGLTLAVSACTPTAQTKPADKSQFDVVRGGVNIDQMMVACANAPKSVGFATTQACFDHAGTLLKQGA
jgi:hypothetical protein